MRNITQVSEANQKAVGELRPLTLLATAQFVALAAFSAVVAVAAVKGGDWQAATVVELLLYAAALVALGFVTRGVAQRKRYARTPFLMFQVFALPAAWQLWNSDQLGLRVAGLALGVSAVMGAALVLRWAARDN